MNHSNENLELNQLSEDELDAVAGGQMSRIGATPIPSPMPRPFGRQANRIAVPAPDKLINPMRYPNPHKIPNPDK